MVKHYIKNYVEIIMLKHYTNTIYENTVLK